MRKSVLILFLLLASMARAQKFANLPRTQNELAILEQKAKSGDIRSQYELGCCYLEGIDGLLTRKLTRGKKLLKSAAKSGSADACRMLFLLDPFHNDNYREQAIGIYKLENSGEAYYKIASMYANAPKTCQRWLKTSKMMGYAQAEKDLRLFYANSASNQSFDQWLDDIVALGEEKSVPTPQAPSVVQPKIPDAIVTLSDVDKDLPIANVLNGNTIAVIVGNQDYKKLNPVSYAQNDASMFARYCETTLGLPKQNIKILFDATLGNLKTCIKTWLPKRVKHDASNTNVIFYYAGHGFPIKPDSDNGNKWLACLVPTDAESGSSIEALYSVDDLTKDLASLGAARVTMFLDACFTGSQLDGRPIAIATEKYDVKEGNMVVFSAASSGQISWPYAAKRHGLFTYYLLKCLQETAGNISLGELSDRLKNDVEYTSEHLDKPSQTPVVTSSAGAVNEWRSWKLK